MNEIPTEILNQLRHAPNTKGNAGKVLMMCWGVRDFKYSERSLSFRVNGRLLKGHVNIELMYDDTYTVKFYNIRKRLVKEYDNTYFDQLVDLIDETVEREVA